MGTGPRRYIPPIDACGGAPLEVRVAFAEAIARVTDAFRDLRDSVLPPFVQSPTARTTLAFYEAWLRRWHLTGIEWIDTWVYCNVLPYWRDDADAAKRLDVSVGTWDAERRLPALPVRPLVLPGWDRFREPWEAYRARVEEALADHRRSIEADMQRYGERAINRRRRQDRSADAELEWLALRIVGRWNCAAIARRYDVDISRIRKSNARLSELLKKHNP